MGKSLTSLGLVFCVLGFVPPSFAFKQVGWNPRFSGLGEEENVSLAGEAGGDVVILCVLFLAIQDLLSQPESQGGGMRLSRI